jgi:serine protease Do
VNRLPTFLSTILAVTVCVALAVPAPAQAPLPLNVFWNQLAQAKTPPPPAAAAVPATAREPITFRAVVKKVLPAVVSIEPQARRAAAKPFPEGAPADLFRRFGIPMNPEEFADPSGGPVRLGTGSGFVIDPSGVVVTNYHVVQGADQVEVRFKDGRKFVSKDIKADPNTDIAIVRIQAKDLPYLEWADSAATEIGDRVLAVGAPFGLAGSVTHGIVSGKGRSLNLNTYEDYIQTDAAINPGNSGGPLVNVEGKVVGVNSVIKSRSGGFQGVGLAVSSDMAKQVASALMKNGAVRRGFLGVRVGDLDPAVAERMGLKDKGGALVAEVVPDGPAAKAGVNDGDVITALGGKAVKSAGQLPWAVATLAPGKPVDLTVFRDGQSHTMKVTLAEQPPDFGTARAAAKPAIPDSDAIQLDKIGAWVTDFTPDRADQFGFRDHFKGALVTRSEGLGALAGLRPGVVITKVDDKPVGSAKDAADLIGKGSLEKGILMQVRSTHGGTAMVMIRSNGE